MFIKKEKIDQNKEKIFPMLFLLIVVVLYCNLEQSVAKTGNNIVPPLKDGKEGTLIIEYKQQGSKGETILDGVEFSIYKVANLEVKNQFANYILTKEFHDNIIRFENMKASESNRAAKKLYGIVKSHNLRLLRKKTDLYGIAKFTEIEHGMYLVVQTGKYEKNKVKYYSEPFLVSVPLATLKGNTNIWRYSVLAKPKTTTKKFIHKPDRPKPDTGDHTETEIWGLLFIACGVLLSWKLFGFGKNVEKEFL
ncbi:MAG: pilin N-terminal domain-containing protein [Hornefia sp.]|nr:pilin N-terminal domain-containing protein [Hornefia sp.]